MKALLTAAVLVALAGCVSTPDKVSDASYRLDRSADELYEELRRDDDDSDAAREARQLAEAADDFSRDVEDDDVSREDLRERFESVAKSYHDLREEIDDDRVGSEEGRAFADVTSAY